VIYRNLILAARRLGFTVTRTGYGDEIRVAPLTAPDGRRLTLAESDAAAYYAADVADAFGTMLAMSGR
jgi:hypothetical protein